MDPNPPKRLRTAGSEVTQTEGEEQEADESAVDVVGDDGRSTQRLTVTNRRIIRGSV